MSPLGRKVVPPVEPKGPVRKVIDAKRHIYEVDGKMVCEQPTPKTPAEEFFEMFVKNVGGLYP